ncbi:hypothetical protein EXQ18_09700 [Salmonella enterica subsp. enterica]|nr:hypothetical protein [Salmonella enterica subsp. enterica]
MEKCLSSIASISGMDNKEIVDLHFALQKEIQKQHHAKNIENAITLCEKAVAISSLVMNAMKKKHRAECDEYARVIGRLSPNSKFYYPNHYASNLLCKHLRSQQKSNMADEIEDKMLKEGWNSGRYADLLDL